jgi:hypothetical protein
MPHIWKVIEKQGKHTTAYSRYHGQPVAIISKSADAILISPKLLEGLGNSSHAILLTSNHHLAIKPARAVSTNAYTISGDAGNCFKKISCKEAISQYGLKPYRILGGEFQDGMFVINTDQPAKYLKEAANEKQQTFIPPQGN